MNVAASANNQLDPPRRMVMHSGACASRGLGGQTLVNRWLESLTLKERKKLHPTATLFFSPRFTPCLMRS